MRRKKLPREDHNESANDGMLAIPQSLSSQALTMLSSASNTEQKTSRNVANGRLGYDFALLGLRARECRVSVIRKAAMTTAAHIQQAIQCDSAEQDAMRADLAVSTYRLLDPRKRQRSRERIQLCVFSEADFELQSRSRRPLLGTTVAAGHESAPRPASKMSNHNADLQNDHRSRQIIASTLILIPLCIASTSMALLFAS